MSSPRIVSVFGATGTQGSSVIDALLKDGTFVPRAITRNPDSEAAQKLKARGVEVVKGDPLDKASLLRALPGSEAVFAMTVPMHTPNLTDGPNEVTQGKNMVDAAKEVGVKFFLFTGAPSLVKLSGGKYSSCLQYESKAIIEDHLRASGLAWVSLHLGAFLENYWKYGVLKKTATGFDVAVVNFGREDRQAFSWIQREVPAATLVLLKNYTDASKNVLGKIYPIVNANISYAELAAKTGKVLGVEVTFTTAPPMGIPAMDEMYAAHAEYSGLYTATPVPNPDLVALGVEFGTIEEFLEAEVKPRFGQ
ncbi:hypothetical protein DFH07DRAFT_915238 [Mycena maculata]|uniref:NmrA-like domain-containing protein n=1 Tax=Mycena maculata TaxID=230809 RepID=A0AAD7NP08_9AGAR|nr:hypothetical protein DFH07DRAFT_915238 [Mycena maculata]